MNARKFDAMARDADLIGTAGPSTSGVFSSQLSKQSIGIVALDPMSAETHLAGS
jgi:hypothetical protein